MTEKTQKHHIPQDRADTHIQWLKELTKIPTAAGHEHRVIAWINHWINDRPDLSSKTDTHGNIEIRITNNQKTNNPIYFTAHLDHPAFVVNEILSKAELILEFRGGVMDDYFPNAKIRIHTPTESEPESYTLATISEEIKPEDSDNTPPNKRYHAILENPRPIELNSIATWDLPDQHITTDTDGKQILYTNACDDLAAAAAALAALDELRHDHCPNDIRLLFTRAEEVGFIGAIGASRDHFMPKASRIIALENSRAFEDSPIHAGPIVRVGDRISIFSPDLTGAIAKVAESISGGASTPTASQKTSDMPTWKWQRKLMAGGACEASVYCAYGYTATCLCLPLGNYHNMANLSEAQAGTHEQDFGTPPRVGCEHIGLDDYQGLIDLLIAIGKNLPNSPAFIDRIEKLWTDKQSILNT
ncbi:MAG: hypothetical protein JKY43_05715 [Phycisphaerales bacterium]|nr:hypothetical protein [Phycisphaerales bacterium]